ncbi:Calcium-transporting ATPase 10, plasma membrane-type [Mortierella claussenii]|nr:Calcium-transporting ATPase 10, plasma membrane-type [Mortierella claussenii]
MIFNTFVFLQVLNELNCRRIDDTLNVFKNMHNNKIFILVQATVISAQFMIVQFGGQAFRTAPLTAHQWLLTILIDLLSLPVGLFLRLLPAKLIPEAVIPHVPEERNPLFCEAIRKKKPSGGVSSSENFAKDSLWKKAYGTANTNVDGSN